MRNPEQVYSTEILRDMTVGDAEDLRKQIDPLWKPPNETGDRETHDRETSLMPSVAIEAIAEQIEAAVSKGEAGFVVDRTASEMVMRPKIMSRNLRALWRVLTIYNTGLPLRECENCGALYAPPNLRPTRFCSKRCRNAHTVRAHRQREKAKQEKHNGEN